MASLPRAKGSAWLLEELHVAPPSLLVMKLLNVCRWLKNDVTPSRSFGSAGSMASAIAGSGPLDETQVVPPSVLRWCPLNGVSVEELGRSRIDVQVDDAVRARDPLQEARP